MLHQLIPNYAETLINVVLDRRNRFLHVPKLPRELHNYLSYEILGRGGQCTMVLAEGVRAITLIKTTDAPSMAWALSATWLAESDVKIEGARVQLGAIQVHVPDQSPLLFATGQAVVSSGLGAGKLAHLRDRDRLGR
ncbi:TcdA/TcdB pore-forming domain-containing protein [Pseudomonas lini]